MKKNVLLFALLLNCIYATAQMDQFKPGPAIKDFGLIAEVPGMEALPSGATYKVSFDLAKAAQPGQVNRSIESLARFINMHVAHGVKVEQIQLALVVHGGAVNDMTRSAVYAKKNQQDNANKALIEALQKHGVQFYVCGQSAAYHGVTQADLLPGVKLSLSAMTQHALLQQNGFTLNPF